MAKSETAQKLSTLIEVEDTASDPSTEFSEASDVECSDSQSDDEPPAFYNEDTVLIFDWDDTARGPGNGCKGAPVPHVHVLPGHGCPMSASRPAEMLPSSWLSEQKLSLDAQSKATPEQEARGRGSGRLRAVW
ncbi:unnamed protein product [Effrenium voratum]|nr:unnamed protein product [Effrenium voratum]